MKKLPTWKTADGRILKLRDMEIGHLINTFHFLKRRAHDEYALYIQKTSHYIPPGIADISVDKFCSAVWPIYTSFREEIAARLRKMPKDSIQRKYWHMKFSNDVRRNQPEYNPNGAWDEDAGSYLHTDQ